MTVAAERVRLPWDEYVALPDDGTRSEYVDGTVVVSPLANAHHQSIVAYLTVVFADAFGVKRVLPGHNWLLRDGLVRIPDLSVLPGPERDTYVTTPPQIVVEVLSPSNHAEDEVSKTVEYAIYGAGTFWLIDPEAARLTVLNRRGDAWAEPKHYTAADGLVVIATPAGDVRVDLTELLA